MSSPSKETDNPNVFDAMLTPIKDWIDEISRHGSSRHGGGGDGGSNSNKKKKQEKNKQTAMSARERLERITSDPTKEKKPPVVAAEVVFVHGACGSSTQFDRMLKSMGGIVRGTTTAGTTAATETKATESSSSSGAGEKSEWTSRGSVRCHLFDAVGCGKSRTTAGNNEWDASTPDEMVKDLAEMVRSVAAASADPRGGDTDEKKGDTGKEEEEETKLPPIYLVGHSYGTSLILNLVSNAGGLLPTVASDRISGLFLISGALSGGPSDVATEPSNCGGGGGSAGVFCLPTFCLAPFKHRMDDAFVSKAVHPTSDPDVMTECRDLCEGNDLRYARAFYRQWRWANAGDAKKVKIKALVVHGEDDRVIVPAGGEHLNDVLPNSGKFGVVPNSSHQVMQEHPQEVANLLLGFIADGMAE